MKPDAEYKVVPGYPAYRVGTDGSVWSRWRRGGRRRLLGDVWHPKVSSIQESGHLRVQLYDERGEFSKFLVHRLVLELFRGPCPPGMESCHNNGIPGDNRAENLRWDTKKGNMADKAKHGTRMAGEDHPHVKLTDAQVAEIRSRYGWYKKGNTTVALGKEFGVSPTQIHNIVKNKWRL